MVDQLYPLPDVVLAQGERLVTLGAPAGPAGASMAELADGSVWQVDHVDPAAMVALEAVGPDPTRSPLMITAFGGEGAMFVAERAVSPGPGVGTEEDHIAALRPGPLRYGPQNHRRLERPAREAGYLLRLADASGDHRLHPLARVAASLEFSLSVTNNPAVKVLSPLSRHAMDVAEQLSGDFDDHDLHDLDLNTAVALHSLCQAALDRGHRGSGGIRRLAERVHRVSEAGGGLEVAALLLPEVADMGSPADQEVAPEFDADDEPVALAVAASPPRLSDSREIHRTEAGLVRIGVTRSKAPRWVRVLHVRGLVLLGQAPVSRKGLMDVAEVVVPAGVADEELQVRVIDGVEPAPAVGGPTAAIRAAVVAGRDAARADRLGMNGEASRHWIRCGELWAGAGDMDRSDQARALAGGASFGTPSMASLSDQVAAALPESS